MKRSCLLQTVCLTTVLAWSGMLRGEDAPVQREDIGRALEMYRWLVEHEEFSAAGKLVAEMQAIHPDDPQVQLIVENAQLRAAVREANRVLVDDEPQFMLDSAPSTHGEFTYDSRIAMPAPPEPFSPAIDWRRLGNIRGSAPVQPAESDIIQASGVAPQPPAEVLNLNVNWAELGELEEVLQDDPQPVAIAEARIHRTLSEPVDLHFDAVPLSEIMRHISEVGAFNVVIDEIGLEEAGVTSNLPVTINVDGVMLKSGLNLVLKPLSLNFMIEDEVLKITSHMRTLGDLSTRVYAVPDLVTPIPHRTPGSVQDKLEQMAEPATAEVEWLTELIMTTIDPDSWSHFGGQAIIHRHDSTLSLVIRQSEQAHDEIGDLLQNLRRLRDIQVTHAMQLLNVPVSDLDELGLSEEQDVQIVNADEQPQFETQVFGEGSPFDIVGMPSITLFNGQTGSVIDSERTLLFSSVSSPDRRTVRLNVAAPESLDAGDVMSAVHSAVVPDGAVALFLVSGAEDLRHEENVAAVLAITPRIQIQEEEEELLGPPMPPRLLNHVEENLPRLLVTPRIIIQEEEEELLLETP